MQQSLIGSLAALPDAERVAFLKSLSEAQAEELLWDWRAWARPNQLAPEGDWLTWVVMAGRGFGKTRCGAEWIREEVMAGRAKRIALVAETQKDLEEVLVFGDSGLASVFPPSERPTITKKPIRIEFKNGALALGYNATEPDQLRGPQFDLAWCLCAGTLIATEHGEVPIEDIRPGDRVWTRKGLRSVINAGLTNADAEIWGVETASGSIVRGTADHPVFVEGKGFIPLHMLQYGDMLCEWKVKKYSGAVSGGIPKMDTITKTVKANSTIESIINRCMGLFLLPLTSIIRMVIGPTTNYPILSRFQGPSICGSIQVDSLPLGQLNKGDRIQRKISGVFERSERLIARIAESCLRLKECALNFAMPIAVQPISEQKIPVTTPNKSVRVSKENYREPVYNLKVDGEPEYFANGVLVHNCDELAKWDKARETWDMLQFGMRLGSRPRQVITTTPRPIPLLREILADPTTVATRGSTYDNAMNLAPSFIKQVIRKYEGTRLGRQELDAEILEDVPGALWSRDAIDKLRKRAAPDMVRVVVAIDPSGTRGEEDEGDSIGIVVAGKGVDGRAYVLADRTCKLGPDGWGRRSISAYYEFRADRIVAERNFGGAMVEHVIRTIDNKASFKEVVASRGKIIRAEPVAALYEQGRVSHVGSLPDLEDQLCQFQSDGYLGEGSPDRADALVWAITELMIEPELLPPTFGTYGM